MLPAVQVQISRGALIQDFPDGGANPNGDANLLFGQLGMFEVTRYLASDFLEIVDFTRQKPESVIS